ncbi:MAG: Endosialidase chaperone, partial [Parcubacteria group bacterium Gr01-1014_18]
MEGNTLKRTTNAFFVSILVLSLLLAPSAPLWASTIGTDLAIDGNVTLNDAGADNLLFGAAADTVTVISDTLSLTDNNWNITAAGLSNFISIGAAAPGTGDFTALSTNAQAGLTFLPFGVGAGNTGEMRFRELAANGVNFFAFKAADNLAGTLTFTLPAVDAALPLVSSGAGVLSFTALTDAQVADVLTSSIFIGGGSTTNAVDLATAEVAGNLGDANINDALTISGGTVNNSVIGGVTP